MKPLSLFLFLASLGSAQFADGITTTVSRSINLTADEAAFSVVAGAPLDTSQQQVTQIFLDAGIICEQGPPEQIFSDPQQPRTREFLARVIEAGRL